MDIYIWIVILVLFVATVVAAYFGSRTWHWAQVLLVVGIFLAAVGYFVLAAETLRINAVLRTQANNLQQELDQVTAKYEALRTGTRDGRIISQLAAAGVKISEAAEQIPSVADLEHQLHMKTRLRGRAWRNVAPGGFDPQTGAMLVNVETPQPSGIASDTILFVFEAGEPALPDPLSGAQYLGEFRVVGVAGPEVTLQTVQQLDEFEARRLSDTRGPLVLHETMPVDRHEIYAGLSEEQLRDRVPEQSVEEYLRHGGEVAANDDQWHRAHFDEQGNRLGPDDLDKSVKEVYQRRLRDYSVEFDELAQRRAVMLADAVAVTTDNQRLQQALASAQRLQEFREEQIRKLGIDLAGVTKEQQIVEKHLATVQLLLANGRQELDRYLRENSRLAERLANLQSQLKTLIDERSSAAPADGPLAVSAP